ncbi:MAG TPA: hypothetical protein VEC99_05010 [Clostridia bacterium]|nr:hypothetical protein [Clostridia bacterium]
MKISNRQQLLAILAGVAVALLAADSLIITPLTKTWKVRTTRMADLRKKVADGRSLLSREEGLRSRWRQMQTNTLPDNTSQAEQQLLKAFDRWSQDSRVGILSISPQWKRDAEDYMTLECRVEAAGDLSTVSRFLYELERDPMAVRLQSVEISSRDNTGQQLALGLQVSGLVLTGQEGAGRGR